MQNQTARTLLSQADENTREKVSQYADALMKSDWIPVETPPPYSCKVKWLHENGFEDIGFFYAEVQQFATFDPNSNFTITHYKILS